MCAKNKQKKYVFRMRPLLVGVDIERLLVDVTSHLFIIGVYVVRERVSVIDTHL